MIHPTLTALALALSASLATAAPAPNTATFTKFSYAGADPVDARFTAAPDQYRNPILNGFYPDPSVTRVGDDYYLVNSTFAYFPGIPVWHSTDLVHWEQIGNAIDRPGMLDFKRLGVSRAVFAPTIEEHEGTFYILNTCVDCQGNFLITARDPRGPWSDPVWLPTVGGIDASIFFDDDGRAWILNNDEPPGRPEYQGHRAIWIQEYDPKARTIIGPRTLLLDKGVDPSTKPIWPEGPHILKKDGWYYLTAAEGGTAEGHSQVVLRSRTVLGPYVPYGDNPILTQRGLPRDRPLPITSAGHADLVDTPDGQWWATFLAVRPYGDDLYNTGRETFLLPVEWKDGWPVILPNGQTIPYLAPAPRLPAPRVMPPPTAGAFTAVETFTGPDLPLNWMTLRIPAERWWSVGHGALTLKARPDKLTQQPSFWGRRQQHTNATAQVTVDFTPGADGDRAGLTALQSDEVFYFAGVVGKGGQRVVRLERRAGANDPVDGVVVAEVPLPASGPVDLKITARTGQYDFAYALKPGAWTVLKAGADGEMLSTRKAGGFVGVMFGVYANGR
ncbi:MULTISPECIES: glycoside hydrolase family 43 protein [unclassified Caulobacter]|uniref:glycoside hydrolase family 43 protein n=1 Tax=unclassified Caulobacter TaxID=2648921 RepID=UPI000D3C97C4|nr:MULTISPECIES: glycoside hydrolase family 43 protein [unclassified Caulobacter]PTS83878.1 glycoside hydrolase 43 family protein [Caulobacter sp. HMWF009]PTT06204.1 glycoside hydrolase 43 family protein [Caulobacter sp. HMWF025]